MPERFAQLRTLLGQDAVERDPTGLPRVSPETTEGVALVCRLARERDWKIRPEGQGTWQESGGEADLVLSTRGLTNIVSLSPSDLILTVEAGASFDAVRRRVAEHGMWLALDPPGRPDRSIGSIAATATWGPLRAGLGTVRDLVLGTTVVAGDGRVLTSGGRVVKNVAGYDLNKLHVGGFGAFGIITRLHLRLRTIPKADSTMFATGPRDALTLAGRTLLEAGLEPAALELLSPSAAAHADWVLAARFLGTDAGVLADQDRLSHTVALEWQTMAPGESSAFWTLVNRAPLGGPMTLRMGVLVEGLDDALDLLDEVVDLNLVTAGAASGGIRWSGAATAEQVRVLRRRAAVREIPITLERAPWPVRKAVGHFGAYREGVGGLVRRLRDGFDPGHCLTVAIEGAEDA